jgi:hypothetical protein
MRPRGSSGARLGPRRLWGLVFHEPKFTLLRLILDPATVLTRERITSGPCLFVQHSRIGKKIMRDGCALSRLHFGQRGRQVL